ncbi:MAG: HdeD family acid-resistance protein [Cyclobacteriaceae bacterium]|jgi:uncharacterized membrane protein HdeD (DUF308 family)
MTSLLKEIKRTVKNWWIFLILGIILVIFGIWVMMTPLESYITLAIFFSAMVFVNGIFDIVFSISNNKMLKGWGWHLAGGILETLLGVILMIHPALTMNILPLMLGFWLMFGAVSIISGAFDLKSYKIKGWGWMLVLGIIVMIFSFMVIGNPIFGSGTIVIMTSIAIISYGVSYITFGMQLKKVRDFPGDLKNAVINNLDDLKKQVLTALKEAKDDASSQDEIKKKFDSFKESLN